MRRIILACALAGILGVSAKAFDETPSPNNPPIVKPVPLDLPFGRPMVCGYAGVCLDLLAQANPSGAAGQGVDPLIGTWKLNLEKSTFIGVPPPKSQTATWAGEGQTLAVTAEGVNAQGQPFKVIFQHIYDGQPHPVTGNPNYDANIFHRIGNSINGARIKNGKVVEMGQGQIIPGKTYTITEEGINANGQLYRDVLVFDRQ
jgi:hypothetical protein